MEEIFPFVREMNEPVMVIRTAIFTRDNNYRVVYVLTAFIQSIVHSRPPAALRAGKQSSITIGTGSHACIEIETHALFSYGKND